MKEKVAPSSYFLATVSLEFPFAYNQSYQVTVRAKDTTGKDLSQTNSFSTIVPSIISIDPQKVLPNPQDLLGDFYRAYFNTAMAPTFGEIKIEDASGDSVACKSQGWGDYSDGFAGNHFYRFACVPQEVQPSTQYTVTFSGFRADDGTTEVPPKEFQYKTAPQMLLWKSIENGRVNVDISEEGHHVDFFFFEALSEAQKQDVESKLKVRMIKGQRSLA